MPDLPLCLGVLKHRASLDREGVHIFLPNKHFYDGFLPMWCNFKFEGVLFRSDSRHKEVLLFSLYMYMYIILVIFNKNMFTFSYCPNGIGGVMVCAVAPRAPVVSNQKLSNVHLLLLC